jgi:hypothetical protein
MPNGLDDLDRQAAERSARRTRTPPPPRHPRSRQQSPAAQEKSEADATSLLALTPAALASLLPEPHEPLSSEPDLIAAELEELDRCESLLRAADLAFWVEGRMLQTIRDGRLYRETHTSFDDYCQQVWERSARRANQLIEVWRLAEYLILEVGKIFPKININEGQVKALLPLANRYDEKAAGSVYRVVAASDRKVTAALITSVISVLPTDRFDEDEATALVKQFLDGEARMLTAPEKAATDPFTAAIGRIQATVQRVEKLAGDDPEQARRVADELEAAAAKIRSHLD